MIGTGQCLVIGGATAAIWPVAVGTWSYNEVKELLEED
jgi:hypothetical protein